MHGLGRLKCNHTFYFLLLTLFHFSVFRRAHANILAEVFAEERLTWEVHVYGDLADLLVGVAKLIADFRSDILVNPVVRRALAC